MSDSLRSDAAVPCLRRDDYHDKEEASTPAVVQCRYGKARPLTMEEVVQRPLLEYTIITSPSGARGGERDSASPALAETGRGSGVRSSPCRIGSSSAGQRATAQDVNLFITMTSMLRIYALFV